MGLSILWTEGELVRNAVERNSLIIREMPEVFPPKIDMTPKS